MNPRADYFACCQCEPNNALAQGQHCLNQDIKINTNVGMSLSAMAIFHGGSGSLPLTMVVATMWHHYYVAPTRVSPKQSERET